MAISKLRVFPRVGRVHPQHHGVLLLGQRPAVTKLAQLGGADRGVVGGVEHQHNVAASKGGERDEVAVLVGEREIGGGEADGEGLGEK